MSTPESVPSSSTIRAAQAARVIIVSSVMFTFISFWRTAAVVLCDLASTAYYIGGIVEQSIGKAAPWFILAVMLFSYCVRSVYIESCSLFVRGGVYRVVKEALGGILAKLSVSALMFDYILTGPISGVSAGQYIMGLGLDSITYFSGIEINPGTRDAWKSWGSVVIAVLCTLYFYWENVKGIHESSDKALKIMKATTVMAVVIMLWCGATLLMRGPSNSIPLLPDLGPKLNVATQEMESPLGFLEGTSTAHKLETVGQPDGMGWLSWVGFLGIAIAFGHSILAMSGEETLAQVYREVESPKMKNFRKAALVVFIYSLVLTAGISFLAVLIIPDNVRMSQYADNLIGGLAMNMVGPIWARLMLNAFVVAIGSLILAGAVNTAIIGSNGVLNRVSEDGVLPDWFLKPHRKYGTTVRLLNLIVGMQLFTIIMSRGDVLLLGEAYAFGVVWSFVFKALAMVVLRFRGNHQRDYKVPFNLTIGGVEIPLGLIAIFFVLFVSAITNLLTKTTATKWGLGFTAIFFVVFVATEIFHERKRKGQAHHKHIEQFNESVQPGVSLAQLGITVPYRRLVAIRSKYNLSMLEKAIADTDPRTTAVVVMTAKVAILGSENGEEVAMDAYEQDLMTAVVDRAEKAGKPVIPLIVPTNNGLFAVLKTAKEIEAQEVVMGLSNKYTADEQFDQIAFYWFNLHGGEQKPLTIRILSADRDLHLDLAGGNRIPPMAVSHARSVADLRQAGVGIRRALFVHDGTGECSDFFEDFLTLVADTISLDIVAVRLNHDSTATDLAEGDRERAQQLGKQVEFSVLVDQPVPRIVSLIADKKYDVVAILAQHGEAARESEWNNIVERLRAEAGCTVLVANPAREETHITA